MKKLWLATLLIILLSVACVSNPDSIKTSNPTKSPDKVSTPTSIESLIPAVSSSPGISSRDLSPTTTVSPTRMNSPTPARNTIFFGSRTLTNNIWGAPQDEILDSGVFLNPDNSFGWYWSRENPRLKADNNLVQPIFPNVRIGGNMTIESNSRFFSALTSEITSLKFEVSYKYLVAPTGAYNLAYELLFSDTNRPNANPIPKAEVMIWIHATFTQPPSTYQGDFTDGNNNYHLYSWIRSDGRLYASFIQESLPQLQADHTVDVKSLLGNLTIDSSWYLLGVEFGSEVVNGSGKIEIDKLSVNLNDNET